MKKTLLAACAATLFAAAAPATAGVIYATDNFDLYTLNAADGNATRLGTLNSTTSGRNVIDMAAAGSTLYGLVREQVGNVLQTRLATIDTATATMTDLPLITGIFTNSGPARRIDTIAYHAGTMYGINNGPDRSLYTIDTTTGAAHRVAALTGFASTFQYFGLGFGSGGVLYGGLQDSTNPVSTQLMTIDTSTGAQTVVGVAADALLADLAYDADSDTFFGGGLQPSLINPTTGSTAALFAINAGTAQVTVRGSFASPGLWSGLAVVPNATVPEPSTLVLAGLAIAGLMGSQVRRSRAG